MTGGLEFQWHLDKLPDTKQPGIGEVVGAFRLQGLLGRGGMGAVYRAIELETGRSVAIKFMLAQADAQRIKRFEREGRLTASLKHPGIVQVHGYGTHNQHPYLVYEFVDEHRSFKDLLRELPGERIAELLVGVAEAVGHAHASGVIHRDLKPENLLVDASGGVRVADFGLARGSEGDRLTLTGHMLGSPLYMAPEQWCVTEGMGMGPHTDVWALGVMLYVALSGGVHPFAADRMIEMEARVLSQDPPPLDSGVPPGLRAVVRRALKREPSDRYADGTQFADALRAALSGDLSTRSNARFVGLALGVLAIGSLVAAGYVQFMRAGPTAPTQEPLVVDGTGEDGARAQARAAQASALDEALGLDQEAREKRLQQLTTGARGNPNLEPSLWGDALARLAARSIDEAPARDLLRLLGRVPRPASVAKDQAASVAADALRRIAAKLDTEYRGHVDRGDLERAQATWDEGSSLLMELGRSGLRAPTVEGGLPVLDSLAAAVGFGNLSLDAYWPLIVAAAQLDLPLFKQLLRPSVPDKSALPGLPWDTEARDPWQRFIALRALSMLRESDAYREELLLVLDSPQDFGGENWSIGPRQWAEIAQNLARLPQVESRRETLLLEARAKDPLNPLVHRSLGQAAQDAGDYTRAHRHAQAGIQVYDETYGGSMYRRWLLVTLLRLEIFLWVDQDERDQARKVWKRLRGVSPRASELVSRAHPWIE